MKNIQWVFSVLFIVMALTSVNSNGPLAVGVFVFALGIVLLPPVNARLSYPKWLNFAVYGVGTLAWLLGQPENRQAFLSAQTINPVATEPLVDSAEVARSKANKKRQDDIANSHIPAQYAVKKELREPDSFNYIEHKANYVGQNGIYVACLMKYRAKNGFGGYSIEKALVTFNDEMKIISVVDVPKEN